MAERQQVNRWIKALLALGVVGGITAIGLGLGGVITIEGGAAGDLTINANSITKLIGTTDLTISTTDPQQDVIFTVADDFRCTAQDLAFIQANNGGAFIANSAAAQIEATQVGSGDDVTLAADDAITFTTGNGGVTMNLTAAANASATLAASGTYYPFTSRLDFDYVNAAPGSTAETVSATQVLPASAMNAVGEGVLVEAWGITAGNVNSKTVRVRIGATGSGTGGTAIAACNFALANDTNWYLQAFIYRSASGAQRSRVWCQGMTNAGGAGTTLRDNTLTAAITDTAIIDLNLTVTNATAASDLTVHGVRWGWL